MKRRELQELLARQGLAPRHRLGQNFLVEPDLLRALVREAGVAAGDAVLEIGPGAGGLTRPLLEAGARVLAVEVDPGLASLLRELLAAPLAEGRLRLVEGDVLGPDPAFHPRVETWWAEVRRPRVVANLPYGISGPLLARLAGRPLRGASLLLQQELVDRALGRRLRDRGPLAVLLHLAFRARAGRRLPPEVFWPRPRVHSAVLHLEPREDALPAEAWPRVRGWLRVAFAERRKMLLPRLREQAPPLARVLEEAGVEAALRPEELSLDDWEGILRRAILEGL